MSVVEPGEGMKRVQFARRLRHEMTDAERRLWSKLRNRSLGGYKFRRQMPIEGFIVDFACVEAKLIVELDGGQHDLAAEADRRRTEAIGTAGYLVLRFWNRDVLTRMDGVLEDIRAALALRAPSD
ncbi:endonuclease domain-containing protein [Bauldia litoralis]|uniref:Very-short-patch-repair endonuclease n=1 Tax=Bauldia litoralis TaxID=665467 RepID=A0A1G6CCC2_9HYPH|nr:DUF559 domain-containing protein [Bauldia litoralis]SDB30536.1 Very-short-patch-repair endonuclease [Bauldia litoralis]